MATHVPLECALILREKFAISDVAETTVRMPASRLGNFCGKRFEARDSPHCDAIFSYRYPVALAKGRVTQEDYTNLEIHSPEIGRLCGHTTLGALGDGAVALKSRCGSRMARSKRTITSNCSTIRTTLLSGNF